MPDNPDTQVNRPAPTAESSIRNALQAIADQIADGSTLTVSTSVQVLDTSGNVSVARDKVEIARTEISIDGDRSEVVPIILDAGSLVIPQSVQTLHEQHVAEAIEYRKHLMEMLVDFIKTRRLG